MFWNIHTAQVGSQFIITVPIHWVGILATLPFAAAGAVWGLQNSNPKRTALIVLGFTLYLGVFIFRSKTTFDRATNTATVERFWFLHSWTRQFPLDQIDNVNVRTGDVVSRLRLQLTSGTQISISMNDSGGNKDQVAFQANLFLGKDTSPPQ